MRPTRSGSACRMLVQKASRVWPDSVRPEASTIVPEITTGRRKPRSSNSPPIAKIAALALRVSKMVSTSSRSAPPATCPSAASRYASGELLEGDVAGRGVVDVRAERARAVGGAQGAGDVAGTAVAGLRLVGGLAGQAGGRLVDLAREVPEVVVRLRDAGRGEGVGAHDVGAGGEVGAMDLADGVGLGEAQEVVVAADVPVVIRETLAPEVLLGEGVALEQRAHRPVQHEDPLAQEPGQAREAGLAGERGLAGGARDGHGAPDCTRGGPTGPERPTGPLSRRSSLRVKWTPTGWSGPSGGGSWAIRGRPEWSIRGRAGSTRVG